MTRSATWSILRGTTPASTLRTVIRSRFAQGVLVGAIAEDEDHAAAEGDDALDGFIVLWREAFHAEELGFGEDGGEGVVEGVPPAGGDRAEGDLAAHALQLDVGWEGRLVRGREFGGGEGACGEASGESVERLPGPQGRRGPGEAQRRAV